MNMNKEISRLFFVIDIFTFIVPSRTTISIFANILFFSESGTIALKSSNIKILNDFRTLPESFDSGKVNFVACGRKGVGTLCKLIPLILNKIVRKFISQQ